MDTADPPAALIASASLQRDDDVLSDLVSWRREGARVALVTLVGIDGTTPRPLGAQMAVAEDGRASGYLSGGCLEQAIVTGAVAAIGAGRNRLVRYGKGSAYLDLELPCGSGLDLYFDQGVDWHVLARAAEFRAARAPFRLATNLETGVSAAHACDGPPAHRTRRNGDTFERVHVPTVRVMIVGAGPAVPAIAQLIVAAGFEISIATPDAATRTELALAGQSALPLVDATLLDTAWLDRWSAAVVAFHEHTWEAPVLARILASPCFYTGVLGSRAAQASRLEALRRLGLEEGDLARVQGPIGMIPGAKSRVTLAAGILAEIAAGAKTQGFLD